MLKRIRDYAKDKLILPSFGGGDQMGFVQGGDLVSRLHFDPIDKDEMCRTWKDFYQEFQIQTRIGVELTGLEHDARGVGEHLGPSRQRQ